MQRLVNCSLFTYVCVSPLLCGIWVNIRRARPCRDKTTEQQGSIIHRSRDFTELQGLHKNELFWGVCWSLNGGHSAISRGHLQLQRISSTDWERDCCCGRLGETSSCLIMTNNAMQVKKERLCAAAAARQALRFKAATVR